MGIALKAGFVKELKRLPTKAQLSVHKILTILRDSESLEKSGLDYTRMKGQKTTEGYYRIRTGQYRIGIEYLHPDVIIVTILSRGNIYKQFPPK